jgi:protein CrcB
LRFLVVLAGGGLGSLARYLVGMWAVSTFGSSFPAGTVLVNVTGSFLIGLIATLADESGAIGAQARLFLIVGILGGRRGRSCVSLRQCEPARRRCGSDHRRAGGARRDLSTSPQRRVPELLRE